MDGTLLNVDHALTPFTMETLYLLSCKRIPFVFATGRHFFSVRKVHEQLTNYFNKRIAEDKRVTADRGFFLVSSNGARVHSPSGELVIERNIEPDIVDCLYKRFALPYTRKIYAGPPGPVISPSTPNVPVVPNEDGEAPMERVSTSAYTTDQWFITSTFLPLPEMEKKFGVKPYVVPFDRHDPDNEGKDVFSLFPREGVGKVCFRSSDRPLLDQFESEMRSLFGDRATICFSSNYCLDVMAKDVSKASALSAVCDLLNRNLQLRGEDQYTMATVASFGDSMNDCQMLQDVGKGFIMSNGQARLKEALPDREVIGHHNDDSVAKKLRKLFGIPLVTERERGEAHAFIFIQAASKFFSPLPRLYIFLSLMLTGKNNKENDEEGTVERQRGPGENRAGVYSDSDYYTDYEPEARPAAAPAAKQIVASPAPAKPVDTDATPVPPPPPLPAAPAALPAPSPIPVAQSPPPAESGPSLPQPAPQDDEPVPAQQSRPSSSVVSIQKVQPAATPAAAPADPAPSSPRRPRAAGPQGFLQRVLSFAEVTPALQRLFIRLFFYYVLVGLFFLILQCPLSQLDEAGGGCYTYWGYKKACDTVSYTYRPNTMPCVAYAARLQIGAAFSIINIILFVGLGLLSWKLASDARREDKRYEKNYERVASTADASNAPAKKLVRLGMRKWVMTGMLGASFVFQLISFSVIASLYSSRPCQDKAAVRTTAYGTGFGLLLTSWCLSLMALPPFAYMSWQHLHRDHGQFPSLIHIKVYDEMLLHFFTCRCCILHLLCIIMNNSLRFRCAPINIQRCCALCGPSFLSACFPILTATSGGRSTCGIVAKGITFVNVRTQSLQYIYKNILGPTSLTMKNNHEKDPAALTGDQKPSPAAVPTTTMAKATAAAPVAPSISAKGSPTAHEALLSSPSDTGTGSRKLPETRLNPQLGSPTARVNEVFSDVSEDSGDDAPELVDVRVNSSRNPAPAKQTGTGFTPTFIPRVAPASVVVNIREGSDVDEAPNRSQTVPPRAEAQPLPRVAPQTPEESDEEDDAEMALMKYLLPRMDAAFAENPFPRRVADEDPPNVLEIKIAQLLYAPWYHSVSFGVGCLCCVFAIVGLPLSQVDMSNNACYTYWGYKTDCDALIYTYPASIIPCSNTRTALMVGCAFAFLSLVIRLGAMGATGYQVFVVDQPGYPQDASGRLIDVATNLLNGAVCLLHLVSWATVVAVYTSDLCSSGPKEPKSYGVGFGLSVSLWVTHFLTSLAYGLLPRLAYFVPFCEVLRFYSLFIRGVFYYFLFPPSHLGTADVYTILLYTSHPVWQACVLDTALNFHPKFYPCLFCSVQL
eukprot:gene8273-5791_t